MKKLACIATVAIVTIVTILFANLELQAQDMTILVQGRGTARGEAEPTAVAEVKRVIKAAAESNSYVAAVTACTQSTTSVNPSAKPRMTNINTTSVCHVENFFVKDKVWECDALTQMTCHIPEASDKSNER